MVTAIQRHVREEQGKEFHLANGLLFDIIFFCLIRLCSRWLQSSYFLLLVFLRMFRWKSFFLPSIFFFKVLFRSLKSAEGERNEEVANTELCGVSASEYSVNSSNASLGSNLRSTVSVTTASFLEDSGIVLDESLDENKENLDPNAVVFIEDEKKVLFWWKEDVSFFLFRLNFDILDILYFSEGFLRFKKTRAL